MSIADEITQRINAALPGAELTLTDTRGTEDHWHARVVTPLFEGMSRVARQRVIYKALGELMAGPVHALGLTTLTPQQAQDEE